MNIFWTVLLSIIAIACLIYIIDVFVRVTKAIIKEMKVIADIPDEDETTIVGFVPHRD